MFRLVPIAFSMEKKVRQLEKSTPAVLVTNHSYGRHKNFGCFTRWNQFSPADEFVFMQLVVRSCEACAEARRLDNHNHRHHNYRHHHLHIWQKCSKSQKVAVADHIGITIRAPVRANKYSHMTIK